MLYECQNKMPPVWYQFKSEREARKSLTKCLLTELFIQTIALFLHQAKMLTFLGKTAEKR